MLARLFNREARAITSLPWDEATFGYQGHKTASGQMVSQDTALQLLAVYGCVSLISDTISTLPVDVFRRGSDGVATEVTKPGWMDQPNEEADWVTWIGQVVTSWLLDGNNYMVPIRADNGSVQQLWNLDPQKVEVSRPTPGPRLYRVDGNPVDPRMLVHVPAIMRAGGVKGLSPIEAARQSIGVGLAVNEFAGSFFGNGSTLSGVIEIPGKLDNDKAQTLRERWVSKHSGASKAHYPGVLTEGAQWKPISITNDQAQFLETKAYSAAEIAGQLFKVDPSMLGITQQTGSTLTYQNIEQRGIHLVQFTLLPWLVRLERMLSAMLPKPQYVKFNVAGLLRADLKTRMDSYQSAILAGVMVPDTATDLEEWPRVPAGDKVRLQPQVALVGEQTIEPVTALAISQLVAEGFDADAVCAAFGVPPIEFEKPEPPPPPPAPIVVPTEEDDPDGSVEESDTAPT